MLHSLTQVLEFCLLAGASIFPLVDQFAVIPMFLVITEGVPQRERCDPHRRSERMTAQIRIQLAGATERGEEFLENEAILVPKVIPIDEFDADLAPAL
jgi:hypothetical protein